MKLLSEHEDVLAEFNSGQVAVPADGDDAEWTEVSQRRGGGGGAVPGCEGAGLVKTSPPARVAGAGAGVAERCGGTWV